MQRHEWRDNSDEEHRFYRATYHAGRWNIATQVKGIERWTNIKEPSQDLWQELRSLLWAKYQRKRCTWKVVSSVDRILKDQFDITPPQ